MHPDYEVVIGLEVHVQLRTRTKLFSTAGVSYGEAPNHHTTPVCLALPGALPVLNGEAVDLAIRAGIATNCEVHPISIFARKNYFYPDSPKGYQISQFEDPLATAGWLDIDVASADEVKRIRLTRIHMEEDAGKSMHDESPSESHIDLNRAGVPLIEIVSEPDLSSAEEAVAYLRKLQGILRSIGSSDADMEKGQFKCDVNVSLRPHGTTELGTRTELKNLNSFRFIEAAIETEVDRQAEILDDGGSIHQATYGYDPDKDRVFMMRSKENADDYRYFPDPDLIPLVVAPERIDAIRAAMPELSEHRRARFVDEHGLPETDAAKLVASHPLADFFEAVVAAGAEAKNAANWLTRDVLAWLNEHDREIEEIAATPDQVGTLLGLVDQGRLTAKSGRDLLDEILEKGGDAEALMVERGLEAVSDDGALGAMAEEVLSEHTEAVASYREGDKKSLNFLMGQVMRKTEGKADPGRVREILAQKLESSDA